MRTLNFPVICCCIGLAACQTTGDPRQGGWLLWREQKAQERQEELRQRALEAEQQNKQQQQLNREHTEQRNSAQVAARTAELRVNALLDENARLERELSRLRARNLATSTTLKSLLAELDATRSEVDVAVRSGEQPEAQQRRADALDDRNRRLQQAILMLSR